MRRSKTAVILLIASNIVTLSLLILISFQYSVPIEVLNKLGITISQFANSNYEYTENYQYDARRSLFQVYKSPKPIKIVMLGNPLTQGADWNELLTRTDVANRGIGSDITEGFINRLSDVFSLNPEICFIKGGINDLTKGISVNQVFQNYTKIQGLQNNKITPIIQSTLHVSTKVNGWKKINAKVDELNTMLKKYANKEGILFLDINAELSKNGALNPIYTYDGIHLLGNGYVKWRDLILLTLSNAQ